MPTMPLPHVLTDPGEPILFRTTGLDVYRSTLQTGSLWLRSDQYYRELEDHVRNDAMEGTNVGTTALPLRFQIDNGVPLTVSGEGSIGQQIIPHYILSLHGSSITSDQRADFGSYTFGIRNLSKLVIEILFQSGQILDWHSYRWGAVYYQRASFTQKSQPFGSAPIQLKHNPPLYLTPMNTDVLRKRPVRPFIDQDEWRVALFADRYLDNDPRTPLRINVSPSHFYRYMEP